MLRAKGRGQFIVTTPQWHTFDNGRRQIDD